MIVPNAIDREGCQPSHLEMKRKEPSNRAEGFGSPLWWGWARHTCGS